MKKDLHKGYWRKLRSHQEILKVHWGNRNRYPENLMEHLENFKLHRVDLKVHLAV